MLQIENLVEFPGQMESQTLTVGLAHRLSRNHFLVAEPTFHGKGELQLVPVIPVGFRPQNREIRWQRHLADTFQIITHLRLLLPQLLLILQMLPLAAPAKPEMPAKRFLAQRGSLLQTLDPPLHITRFLADDLHIGQIARHGIGDKKHLAVHMRQRIAFGGGFLYPYISQNRVRFVLALAAHKHQRISSGFQQNPCIGKIPSAKPSRNHPPQQTHP